MPDRYRERAMAPWGWVTRWDLVLLPLVIAVFFVLAWAGSHTPAGQYVGTNPTLSLDPALLPIYALKTTLRMACALVFSFAFTLLVGTWAAKSARAEKILVPLLDIGQSVPILGFLPFALLWALKFIHDPIVSADIAAIFAIFTSQVWNMAFSYYHSLKLMPKELKQAASVFQLSTWQRFRRLELPHAMPGLVWNTMMSVSGGWFFVVAAEAITVSDHRVLLPGIGSYISVAISHRDLGAIGWAILAMFVVIMLYDQLAFRPLVAWAEKFKMHPSSEEAPRSWFLNLLRRSGLVESLRLAIGQLRATLHRPRPPHRKAPIRERARIIRLSPRLGDASWNVLLGAVAVATVVFMGRYILVDVGGGEIAQVFLMGFYTLVRVVVLTALASLIWVPIGVWIGLSNKWARRAQPFVLFLSAFPANLLFPLVVVVILSWQLNLEIWLSPLMVLGAQWYILFNVIAGAQQVPGDLREVADNLGLKGWRRWKRLYLPAILPSYVTGGLTAAGAAWNASIVAEIVSWGPHTLIAKGLGSYIALQAADGDQPRLVLGIAVMIIYVLLMNRLIWSRLYRLAERRYADV
ncbi:MAG: ABC transporter permease subunit [Gammaproteobacteria bacterium]|nr:ABC transporter permease subunit [Gammaproteobacteria bacterium]